MLKLLRTGINGKFFAVVNHMYQNCESCIRLGGSLSEKFKCDTGVRQGDVMSPNYLTCSLTLYLICLRAVVIVQHLMDSRYTVLCMLMT